MEFESRHDIRAKTNMRPKLITDPGCQTCEFDLNFEEAEFEPKYNLEPTELSAQEKAQISAELDALDYDPSSCVGEECWQDFPDQTDNGMRTVSSESQNIDEGIFDKFKKDTYTVKANLEQLTQAGYCSRSEAYSFAEDMRNIITKYRVEDLEEAAPISNSFGLHPAFRFKTASATLTKIEKQLESAYGVFLHSMARKHRDGEAGRIFGIRNPNQEQNIKHSFMNTVKIGTSGNFMDKNIYFASV